MSKVQGQEGIRSSDVCKRLVDGCDWNVEAAVAAGEGRGRQGPGLQGW